MKWYPNRRVANEWEGEAASTFRQASASANLSAPSALVNRTHRIVRQRASGIQEQRRRTRGLWAPMAVSFGLLALLLTAVWSLLDESEFLPAGLPDAAQQMLVLSLWFLPLSAAVLAVVLLRRSGSHPGNGSFR